MSRQGRSNRTARPSTGARLLSDERLARRAARNDERAFAEIYRRYSQGLYRFCLSIVGNSEDAGDALQNTMVKALKALPGEERRIQLRPWLYRVAHNESVELLRRRREAIELGPDLAAPGAGTAETAARRERLRQLLRDLAELPERQRAMLVMRELAGLGLDEIGEAFETSAAVARQTVYEARLSLRQLEAGREMSCEEVKHRLSDADGRVARRRDLQAHLRACPDCRQFRDAIETRQHDLAALAPLPAVAATGILDAVIASGHGATAEAAAGAAVAAGAGKAVATSAVVKSVATVAVAATVGVSVADRSGLVDVGLPGGSSGTAAREATPGGTGHPAGTGNSVQPAGSSIDSASQAADRSNPSGRRASSGQSEGPPPSATDPPMADGTGKGPPAGLPPASDRGQQTAAAHKAQPSHSKGSGGSHGASAHPHGGKTAKAHENAGSSTGATEDQAPSGEGRHENAPRSQAEAGPAANGSAKSAMPVGNKSNAESVP